MRKSLLALTLVGAAVAGCSENQHPKPGVTAGAVARASIPTVDVFAGAAVGAPIPGLSGAVWADPNNSGYVTGYSLNGKYSAGAPPGYDPVKHAVVPAH